MCESIGKVREGFNKVMEGFKKKWGGYTRVTPFRENNQFYTERLIRSKWLKMKKNIIQKEYF